MERRRRVLPGPGVGDGAGVVVASTGDGEGEATGELSVTGDGLDFPVLCFVLV